MKMLNTGEEMFKLFILHFGFAVTLNALTDRLLRKGRALSNIFRRLYHQH